jgi:hypothetical protein
MGGANAYASTNLKAPSDAQRVHMVFNRELSALSPEKYRAKFKRTVTRGWWTPEGNSVSSTVAHEFGHAIRFMRPDQFSVFSDVMKAIEALDPSVSFTNFTGATQWIKRNISEYAAKNPEELIAESFSEVVRLGDDARPAARAVVDALMKRRMNP